MSTSKTLIAVFAVLGLVALIAFTTQGSGRSLLAKVDSSETEVWNNFQNFMKNHNKTYSSVQEMQDRFKIFHDNYYWVKVQNTRNLNTKYGINHFSDLTQQEFNDQYLGYLFNPDLQVEYEQESNIILAASIDWEQKGAVAPVKNQAQCGSCWSFSAVAALEGAYFQKTGKLATFSEQQLVDCSGSYGNQGCNGGLMNNAFKYWESYAAETESSYPYKGTDGTCRFDSSKGVVKVSDYKSVWPSESSLEKAINEHVVSVAVDATNWKNYAGGIFDGECSTLTLNHGVTLVGYGTDNGQDYWRIKNSWTTSWGDKGYIKLKKTNSAIGWGQCGIARQASYPILA